MGQGKRKCTGENRLQICKMLAHGYSVPLIVTAMREDHGVEISAQSIYETYKRSNKYEKVIKYLRKRMVDKVMEHPIANANVRLGYLLRALNYATNFSVDKLYFDKDGNLLAKLEKVNVGGVAALVKEAREEVALLTGKSTSSTEVNVHLLQIIKEASNASRKPGTNPGNRVFPAESAAMDSSDSGDLEVL